MKLVDQILRLWRRNAPEAADANPPQDTPVLAVAGDLTLAAQVVVVDEASGNEVELRVAAQDGPGSLSGVLDPKAFKTLLSAGEIRRQETSEHSSSDDGYALYAGETCLIEPACCGSLSDIHNWRAAVETADDEWRELWIGHPCLIYRRDGDGVLIQNGFEPGGSPIEPAEGEPIYRLSAPSLSAAIEAAESAATEVAALLGVEGVGSER